MYWNIINVCVFSCKTALRRVSLYTGKFLSAVVTLVSGKQTNKHGDYGVVPLEHSMSPQA